MCCGRHFFEFGNDAGHYFDMLPSHFYGTFSICEVASTPEVWFSVILPKVIEITFGIFFFSTSKNHNGFFNRSHSMTRSCLRLVNRAAILNPLLPSILFNIKFPKLTAFSPCRSYNPSKYPQIFINSDNAVVISWTWTILYLDFFHIQCVFGVAPIDSWSYSKQIRKNIVSICETSIHVNCVTENSNFMWIYLIYGVIKVLGIYIISYGLYLILIIKNWGHINGKDESWRSILFNIEGETIRILFQ